MKDDEMKFFASYEKQMAGVPVNVKQVGSRKDDLKRRRRYSMGSLGKDMRKDKRDGEFHEFWIYRYFDPQAASNGNRPRLSVTVGRTDEMTRDEALREVQPFRMMANTERPLDVAISMHGLIQRYIKEILEPCLLPLGGVQSPTARMSDCCARGYRNELVNWVEPTWGSNDVREFERPEMQTKIEQWLPTLVKSPHNPTGRKPRGMRQVRTAMRLVFKWGVKWGYLNFNPIADKRVELPRGATSQRHVKKAPQLTPAQFFLLVDNLPIREKTAVALDGWLGTRRSEAFGLKWRDLNLDNACVKFRQGYVSGRITPLKNEASRTDDDGREFPIPTEVVKLLRQWRRTTPYNRPDDWVFASLRLKGKRPYDPQTMMKKQILPVALSLGLPEITWHSFRHTESRWAKAVCPKLEDAKELTRHEDAATLSKIYGAMSLEEKRELQQQMVKYVSNKAKSKGKKHIQ